ncbi:hypothetical protein B5S29_g861 [[Candida] boidinii]|nr:hypothetical protein B5S29_g861 [[Candida] boidinii]
MEVPSVERQRIESLEKIKATWKSIIDKYSSFSENDQGDMIDIRTGEIINDKGHLRSLNDPTLKTGNVWTVFLNNDDSITESDDINGDESLLNLSNDQNNNNKNTETSSTNSNSNTNTDADTNINDNNNNNNNANTNNNTNANTNTNNETNTKNKTDNKSKTESSKQKSTKKKDSTKNKSRTHVLIKPKSLLKKPSAKKSKKKSSSKGETASKVTETLNKEQLISNKSKVDNEQLISNQPKLDNGQLIWNQATLISTSSGDTLEYQDSPHFSKRNTSRRLRSEISNPDNLTIMPTPNGPNHKRVRVRKLWYFPNDQLRLVSPTFGSVANDSIQISSLEDLKQNDAEYKSMVSKIPFDLCYSGSRFSPSKVRRFRMSIEKNKQHINNNERSKRLKKLILKYQRIKKPEPNYLVPPLVIDLTNSRSSTDSDMEFPQNENGGVIKINGDHNMIISDEDEEYEEDQPYVPEDDKLEEDKDDGDVNEDNESDELESDEADTDTDTDTDTDDESQAENKVQTQQRRSASKSKKKIDSNTVKNDSNIAKNLAKTIQNIDSGINNSTPNKEDLAQIITDAVKILTKKGQSDESACTKSTENTNNDKESETHETNSSDDDDDSDEDNQKEDISNRNGLVSRNNNSLHEIGSEESSSDESDADITSDADLPLSSSLRRPIILSDSESEDDDDSDKEEGANNDSGDDSEVEEINIEQQDRNNPSSIREGFQTWDYSEPNVNRETMETVSNDDNDLIAPLIAGFQQQTLSPTRKDNTISNYGPSLFVPDDIESDTDENLLNMNVRTGIFSDEESLFVKDQFFDENES